MKKILSIVSSLGLTSIFSSSIAACSWKVPPISVEQLGKIFHSVAEQSYLHVAEDTRVGRISSGEFKMMMDDTKIDDQTSELSKIWADGLTTIMATDLVTKITTSKNILDGANATYVYEEQPIATTQLQLVANYHFTIRISDILAVDKNKWLSESNYLDKKISKTEVIVNKKPVAIQAEHQPLLPNSNEINYSAVDINGLWALQNEDMQSKTYVIRYLFSFTPTSALKISPTLFYVEAVMES